MEDKDHSETMGNKQPYFTFGVIADVQYADRPTAPNCWGSLRYYRDSLTHFHHAVAEWSSQATVPNFVLQLGDIIDSSNKRLQESENALEKVLQVTEARKHERQLVNFNGGVGKEQLSWLHKILTYADEQEEKVVIASHVPIHPNAQVTNCLAWNYSEILDVLHRHSCVVSYIAGHEHHGAYCQDSHGIHHITMEGVIESPPNTNAFATVHMYKNKMVLHGRGRVKSREMSFVQNGQ
ncbi:hypothetical protein XENTR_v10004451 [Xenopus tropicalis]|nr:hypothetical protein XENTR_v10004451 [Xenopus tropicalis]KAE8577156.1 hypothetical protein XENTR_v10004451 [Xenopus tropicalis]